MAKPLNYYQCSKKKEKEKIPPDVQKEASGQQTNPITRFG